MKFEEKVIAFVDILGFKNLIESSESGNGKSLPEVLALLDELGRLREVEALQSHGSSVCPESTHGVPDLNFEVTQLSDCAIVSAEVTPLGALNVAFHCHKAVMALMRQGLMCRGYITKGSVHHTRTQIVGTGYQRAYEMESQVSAFKVQADEQGTPFVEVEAVVANIINDSSDKCVKEMFSRMVKSDGDVVAIYPFQRLGHSFIVNSNFSPEKEMAQVQVIREAIYWFKDNLRNSVDVSNESANRKVNHYVRALDEQLQNCDKMDQMIVALTKPLGELNPGLFKK